MSRDNHREFRCFGPPGTGKTTWLSRQIEKAVASRGPTDVIVCSFTRAAVHELNSRQLPIPESNLGTLHAIAYRALGNPNICETAAGFKAFHEATRWELGGSTRESVDDGYAAGGNTDDDMIFLSLQAKRARQIPPEMWTPGEQRLWRDWEAFKAETGQCDFTDLISDALKYTYEAPGSPSVGFFDEGQDFTPLELALVRHWGDQMETFTLAGDDDQSIYGFKGVTTAGLLNPPLPPENVRILKQSYRVPAKVHRRADRYIHQIHNDWRQEKEYLPREAEGQLLSMRSTYKYPDEALDLALEYTELGKTVLWLTSCSYMLSPLIKKLREQGIPFSNPYRRRRGDWNPLYGKKNQNSVARMVAAFMNMDERVCDFWLGSEIKQWAKLLKGVFNKGAKDQIDRLKDDIHVNIASLHHYMTPENARAAVGEQQMQWLKDNLLASWKKSADYVFRVAERGAFWLTYEPLMRLGTIHSVKGGQADVVILFPDVSPQALQNPTLITGRDYKEEPFQNALIRQFYVGMTRAKETLVICSPASSNCVQL